MSQRSGGRPSLFPSLIPNDLKDEGNEGIPPYREYDYDQLRTIAAALPEDVNGRGKMSEIVADLDNHYGISSDIEYKERVNPNATLPDNTE